MCFWEVLHQLEHSFCCLQCGAEQQPSNHFCLELLVKENRNVVGQISLFSGKRMVSILLIPHRLPWVPWWEPYASRPQGFSEAMACAVYRSDSQEEEVMMSQEYRRGVELRLSVLGSKCFLSAELSFSESSLTQRSEDRRSFLPGTLYLGQLFVICHMKWGLFKCRFCRFLWGPGIVLLLSCPRCFWLYPRDSGLGFSDKTVCWDCNRMPGDTVGSGQLSGCVWQAFLRQSWV